MLLTLTALVEAVQLQQVTVTELHSLSDDIAESRDLGDDGGLRTVLESTFAVVHHGVVVVGHAQRAGNSVIICIEVVFSAYRKKTKKKTFFFSTLLENS